MRLEPREFEMKFDSCAEPWPPDRLTLTVGDIESQWLAATPEREAASDLLAALKALMDAMSCHVSDAWNEGDSEAFEMAEAAVAKAMAGDAESNQTLSLVAAAPVMLAELRHLEWSERDEFDEPGWCPSCHNSKSAGHDERCMLAAAIAKAAP